MPLALAASLAFANPASSLAQRRQASPFKYLGPGGAERSNPRCFLTRRCGAAGSVSNVLYLRGRSGAVGNNTANVTASPGSNPGDPEAALASGSRPLPTRAMVPVENM